MVKNQKYNVIIDDITLSQNNIKLNQNSLFRNNKYRFSRY